MSLLATEDIGVFNQRHIALDANFAPTGFRGNTHRATWDIFSAWSDETGNAEKLLGAISLGHKSLSDWLAAVGALQPSRRVLARDWLRAWSLDLQVLATDRKLRNEMSYRPIRIRLTTPVDADLELTAPLFQSWEVLEPLTAEGTGVLLDSSLLRRAIALAVKERWCGHSSPDAAVAALKDDMPGPVHEALHAGNASADAILDRAEDAGAEAATPILARALLMLRLASASTATLLAAAEVSKADLNSGGQH